MINRQEKEENVTSLVLSYPTHRLGLVVSGYKGVLDRGFSSCNVLAFCCSPGISSCMQVYALPKDCREVAELKGTVEIVSGLAQVEKLRIESQIVPEARKYQEV